MRVHLSVFRVSFGSESSHSGAIKLIKLNLSPVKKRVDHVPLSVFWHVHLYVLRRCDLYKMLCVD